MTKKAILEQTGSFHEYLIDSLRDPKKAASYLKVALDEYQEDNDMTIFLLALRNIAEARGGVGLLAKKTHLGRQNLYKTLSSEGNPRLDTLGSIIKALGFHLSIEPDLKRAHHPR